MELLLSGFGGSMFQKHWIMVGQVSVLSLAVEFLKSSLSVKRLDLTRRTMIERDARNGYLQKHL